MHNLLSVEGSFLPGKQNTARTDVVVTFPTDSSSVVAQLHIHPARMLLNYLLALFLPDSLNVLPADHNHFHWLPRPRIPSTADPTPLLVAHSDLGGKSLNRSRRYIQDSRVFPQIVRVVDNYQMLL